MTEADRLPSWLAPALAELLHQRGHAWLLHGPSGLGQYPLGLALAAAWLCESPTDQGACGRCPSCHAIAVRTHADLCVLMPETAMQALDWPLDEKAQADIDDKKRKPSREIRVEAMRETVAFTQQTSARGRGKVVLIYPAERMNAITANTLLKTLEEPTGEVRFVLASEAAWQLLPTIRSRCLGYAVPWPDEAQGCAWLEAQGIDAAQARILLRAAGGRPHDALRLSGDEAIAFWQRLPKAMARGEVAVLAAQAAQTPSQAIDVLQKLCHDLMAAAQGAAPRFFDIADLPPAPPMQALAAWSKSLADAARSAEHPFNAGLMLEALVSEAHAVLAYD